jgi:hypothetical protein
MQWPDRAPHEYQTMIELGLIKELLELGGPDLAPFLHSASNYETTQVQHSLQVLFLYSLLSSFFNRIPIEL